MGGIFIGNGSYDLKNKKLGAKNEKVHHENDTVVTIYEKSF